MHYMLKAKVDRLARKFNFVQREAQKYKKNYGQLFGYSDFFGLIWGITAQTSYAEGRWHQN